MLHTLFPEHFFDNMLVGNLLEWEVAKEEG